MRNHREIKDFRKIEGALAELAKYEKPIVFLDTGALIDIQRKSEEANQEPGEEYLSSRIKKFMKARI
jgi:hypothetical protein